jgi:hypothetical protein
VMSDGWRLPLVDGDGRQTGDAFTLWELRAGAE